MANLTRFRSLDENFNDFLNGFFVHPLSFENPGSSADFKVDIKENKNAYTLRADIPGVKKEDIKITIEGNQVLITAETKQDKEVKDGEYLLRSERYYGKIARSFQLASEIDEAAAEAKLNDGVLELVLPKKAVSSAKTLIIQ